MLCYYLCFTLTLSYSLVCLYFYDELEQQWFAPSFGWKTQFSGQLLFNLRTRFKSRSHLRDHLLTKWASRLLTEYHWALFTDEIQLSFRELSFQGLADNKISVNLRFCSRPHLAPFSSVQSFGSIRHKSSNQSSLKLKRPFQ